MMSTDDHAPLDAVDALFSLRAEIARLREREIELCDEILSFATENGETNVAGATRMAVIETRHPRRIDPGKLPHAILSDPHFFETDEQTVVLLWPHPDAERTNSAATYDTTSVLVLSNASESCDLPVDTPEMGEEAIVYEPSGSAQEPERTETVSDSVHTSDEEPNASTSDLPPPEEKRPASNYLDRLDQLYAASPSLSEAHPDTSADLDATVGVAKTDERQNMSHDMAVAQDAVTETREAADGSAPEKAASPFDVFVSAQLPFGRKTAAPYESSTLSLSSPVDARDAEERDAPRDLRPTGHVDLQPMAGLPEEEIAALLADADEPMDAATVSDALEETLALEAQADLHHALGDVPHDISSDAETTDTDAFRPTTPFSSRRLAAGGES